MMHYLYDEYGVICGNCQNHKPVRANSKYEANVDVTAMMTVEKLM